MIWRVNQMLLKHLGARAFPDFYRTGAPSTVMITYCRYHSGGSYDNLALFWELCIIYITSFDLHNKSRKYRLSSSPPYRGGDQVTEKWSNLPKSATNQWWSSNWDPGDLRLSGREGALSSNVPTLSFSIRMEELELAPRSSHPKLL